MTEATPEDKYTELEFHRKQAVALFNQTWDLMELASRTAVQDDLMIHACHASRYHWSVVGSAIHFQRGEWQLARVYAVLRRPEAAVFHARRCLQLTEDHGFGDFDLAFAYEALARAGFVSGAGDDTDKYYKLAEEAGAAIAKEEDRDWFFENLKTIVR